MLVVDSGPAGKRFSVSLLARASRLAVAACAMAWGVAVATPPSGHAPPGHAVGRLLVAPLAADDEREFHRALAAHGARSKGRFAEMDVHSVEVPPGLERVLAVRLAQNPHVRFAEVDELVPLAATVNDPRFANEWHLTRIGAPSAWDLSTGHGVTIAILDTGVDADHPDLVSQLVPGWNFYDNNSNTDDVHGHGTAVAGTAAARSNNSVGVASVAWSARIMPIRISDPTGYAYWSTVAQGLNWAANQGARVANISYQGVAASSTVQTAASYFRSKGGVVVVAAGNTGASVSTAPSGVMLVVGATNELDQRASFSTFGNFLDISAPGTGIVTTGKGGVYQSWSGTSFASPIVAASAALVISRRPDLTPEQVDTALLLSAKDLGTAGLDIYFGAGRVEAAAAVQRASGMPVNTVDTSAPSVSIAAPTGGTVASTISVNVNASDNVGVAKVELRVNGQVVATRTASPYTFSWDSRTVANGSVALSASAYDAKGNAKTSAGVTVTVNNVVVADTTPPTLTITSPTAGSTLKKQAFVATAVSDNNGAAGIKQMLYIDGVLKSTVIGAPLSYKWNTSGLKRGTHIVMVVASDATGNSTTRQVQVTK
jgi:thermitase